MSNKFQCRSCGAGNGELVLDLGMQPLANNLLRPADLGKPEPKFPLGVFVCPECWLLQLTDLVPPVELFSEYLYFSSFSSAMVEHARMAVERHCSEMRLGQGSLVVEVASNDGYLLQYFQQRNVPCLGIEPAANVATESRAKGIETLTEFFGLSLAQRVAAERGKADLVLGNNVFAHAPKTNDFVAGLQALLKPGGRCVLEFPYGVDLVEKNEFDTVYHEHVFYFTLSPLIPLFRRHGLEVFHVEWLPIHGGSLRLFAGHAGAQTVRSSVTELLTSERRRGVDRRSYYRDLADRTARLRSSLLERLSLLRTAGARIAAYGASAKGSTLLNYCGIDASTLDFVADRSTHKHHRLTPGTHLPIVPVEELLRRRPDYTLLLTWNFAEEILMQQRGYREQGGKFIIPIPEVRIV